MSSRRCDDWRARRFRARGGRVGRARVDGGRGHALRSAPSSARSRRSAGDASQRLPPAGVGDAGRRDRAVDPAEAVRAGVLPELPGAAPAVRAGDRRGRAGGLRQRRLDPQGRPAGRAARDRGDDQGPRRRAVPRRWTSRSRLFRAAAAGGRLPVSVARRQARQGPRPRPRASPRRWWSPTRVHETGRARGDRPGHRRGRDRAFWVEFLRVLQSPRPGRACGWRSPISTKGSRHAIARVLACPWQRCTVHFVRDMLGHCRRDQRGLVSAALREVFNADDQRRGRASASARCIERLAAGRAEGLPAARGRRGGPDRLLRASRASTGPSCGPPTRWSASTARSAAAPTSSGSSPTTPSAIRLAGALLIEQNDEWLVARRYLSVESMALILDAGRFEENSLEQQPDKTEAVALNAA